MNSAMILYAEDDENDVFLMQHAFRKAGLETRLKVVNDGQSAIDYLEGRNGFGDRSQFPTPGLLLLDLKLPHQSGLEVLEWIRTSSEWKTLPVLMFTSSNLDSDIDRAYILGANSYLIKPGKPGELASMVNTIRDYWLNFNQPPRCLAAL